MTRARDLASQADLSFDGSTFKIDTANDRVGIGTDNPSTKLHIDGGGSQPELRVAMNSTYYTDIGINHIDVNGPNDLRFLMGGADKVRFKSDGKVGIGTIDPQSMLHVETSASDFLRLTSATGNNDTGIDFFKTTTRTWNIRNNGNNDYLYITPASITDADAVLSINPNGNVGIGTTDPGQLLEVNGSGATIRVESTDNNQQGIEFYQTNTKNASIMWGQGSANLEIKNFRNDQHANNLYANIDFFTGGSNATSPNYSPNLVMRLTDDGKVGIGETSPQATLHLDTETSGLPRIRFDHQNASADVFEIGSGVDGQTNAGFSIKDVDENATRLVIDNNGVFMLNKLYSNGSLTGFEHRGTGQTWITMNQATNEGVLYINQTTGGGNNNADSGLVILGHGTNAVSGQSTLLRVEGQNPTHGTKDAFTVTNNGRVGIGTYKPTDKLNLIAGNGGGLLMSTYFNGTVTSGMFLGELGFKGYADGNTTASADAKIVGMSDGNHSGTSAPARLDFYTKDSSIGPGSAPTRRFRIDEQGAAFVHASKNNWSRFVQADNSSVHYRLYGASSSTTTYNLLRYRRHYWGSGSVHITLFQTYYSTTSQGEYWLSGHGRSSGSYTPNYAIQYQDIYNGPGSGRLSTNMPGGAPGNSDAEIVDVSISIPAYVYYLVKIQVSHSTFYPTTTVMGANNSYALFS